MAFTGGVNLADEYINLKERFGHWKDNAVMVTGEAVRNFSAMFLQMWHAVPEDGTPAEALPELPGHAEADARNLVIPYADSPLDNENIGKSVYLDLINHAKRYVHIFTPYLVLDSETDTALRFAAKKGVEVHFILPHIPDKKYVYLIAHNQYPRLIASGVHISEYTPGFVHAKTMVADDEVAVVGTINMDFRSYYLHFENAVLFTQEDAVADVEADFQKTLKDCHEVTLKECENYPLYQRVLGWIFQMFAPLM